GEMQNMASSVGDLKRVLTNVKTRGTWGEIQLGALLEQVLTPRQYAANVAPKPNSAERVEYAIQLPGKDGVDGLPVWLPIDAKFPQEDYQRLIEATEVADVEAINAAGKALETRLRSQAKDIRDKYIAPPYTTDFAILFLPSEGLYAEALRRPGLWDRIQADYRVVIAGPTTIAALLNSLQMGFKTLAIQERSSEVWRVLAGVKKEFDRFGDVLAKVKRKIEEAGNQIEQTEVRTRAIHKQLRAVEAPTATQNTLLAEVAPLEDDELADAIVESVTAERELFDRQTRLDK
ncbi:MAG TPA: DNA recombination protein RmuC, partial [Candidatus Kapabacteria bacterium]|nr:DNA recombination protein RmuC [Candidatus Kapabacteria bacterium]